MLLWLCWLAKNVGAFTSVWSTSVINETITLPLLIPLPEQLTIHWGDESTETFYPIVNGMITHSYSELGLHNVSILGNISGFRFDFVGDTAKLVDISDWSGFIVDANSTNAFAGCTNLQVSAVTSQPVFLPGATLAGMFRNNTRLNTTFNWNLANVESLDYMFENARDFDQPINFTGTQELRTVRGMFKEAANYNSALKLNTSTVKIMSEMFQGASKFNQLLDFDTPNVLNMESMFSGAKSFNQFLGFDTANVKNMSSMFSGATSYNRSIAFSTGRVTDMSYMFQGASAFNQPLPLNTTSVTNMNGMFWAASSFNNPLNWDTANVLSMDKMFHEATNFNQALSFVTTKVMTMSFMFASAIHFNQPLNFNTADVNSMNFMFSGAASFNQPVNFTMGKVQTTYAMFSEATSFNHPLKFNTSSVTDMSDMFLSASSFNQPLKFNTGNVLKMNRMFHKATAFNQPITFDTTAKVTEMEHMFSGAAIFNQDLNFSTGQVTTMAHMFRGATAFNSELTLDTGNVTDFSSMFEDATSFNRTVSFSTSSAVNMSRMFANAVNFSQAVNLSSTTRVADMTEMFLNVTGFEQMLQSWDTQNVTRCSNFCPWCGLPAFPSCSPCGASPRLRSPRKGSVCNCPDCDYVDWDGTQIVVIGNGTYNVTISPDPAFGNGTLVVGIFEIANGTVSNVISVVFVGPNGVKNVTNLTTPIMLIFPLQDPATDNVKKCVGTGVVNGPLLPQCGYFNESTKTWETNGCNLAAISGTHVECSCTHLTDFAVLAPNANDLVPTDVLELTPGNIAGHPTGLVAVLTVLGIFAVVFALALVRDHKEAAEYEQLRLTKQDKWASFATERKKATFWKQVKIAFQKRHTWFSLVFRKKGTSFQSVDRTYVALFAVFASMAMSAHYHAQDNNEIARAVIFLAAVCACWLPSQVLAFLFVRTGKIGFYEEWEYMANKRRTNKYSSFRFSDNWRYVWRLAIFVTVISLVVYVLTMSMRFDLNPIYYCQGSPSLAWVSTWLSAYAITVLVIEPARILFLAVIEFYATVSGVDSSELSSFESRSPKS